MDMFENYSKREIIYNDVYLGYIIDDYILENENTSKFDFIDKIYVISLEHRDDRRIKLIENLKKIGIKKISFMIPLKFKDIKTEDKIKLNDIFFENFKTEPINYTVAGCFLSHLICYKDLNNFNVKNCIILEDDCEFYDMSIDIYNEINNFIINENYDAFFLHNYSKREVINEYKINKYINKKFINDFNLARLDTIKKYKNIEIFFGTSLTHCIFYSAKYINYLANNLKINIKKNETRNIDYTIHIYGKQFDYYTTKQNYTGQFISFSDITFTYS